MTSVTPIKKNMAASTFRSSYQPTTAGKSASPIRSANTSPNGNRYNNVKDIPLDPKAEYTISYLPGVSEHNIDTGKTHDEARMKIVLLTCELERINSYNYTLVRENEVLRVQANKSEREKDLETKLAIVLAENEKLNQVIEDVYEAYMSQKGYGSPDNQEYENRLAELYGDLEDWKQKYNVLESQTNIFELQSNIKELQSQKDLLSEQLTRKDRDLETFRARLMSLEQSASQLDQSHTQNNSVLFAENENLRKELEAMRLKYGKADSLQLKLSEYDNKVRTVLNENEKLNNLLMAKMDEINELKSHLTHEQQTSIRVTEFNTHLSNQIGEHQKKVGAVSADSANRVQELLRDNNNLQDENLNLKNRLAYANELENQLNVARAENQKLLILNAEKDREISGLSVGMRSSQDTKSTVDRLSAKLNELLIENERLNRAVEEKIRSASFTEEENKRLREQLEQRRRENEDLLYRSNQAHSSLTTVSELQEKIIIVSTENERLHNQISKQAFDNDSLHRKIASLEAVRATGESAEERVRLLLAENQRLAGQIRDQGAEIDALKARLHSNDVNGGQIESLNYKITLLTGENDRIHRELENLRAKAREDRTIELNSQINYVNQEKSRLEALVNDKSSELARLNAELANLRGELSHLKDNHLRVFEGNVKELTRQNETLKNAGAQHQSKINELEGRLGQVFALETKVNYFNIELEKLHRDVEEREGHIRAITQKFNDKERENDELKRRLFAAENQRQTDVDELKFRLQSEQERKIQEIRGDLESQIRRISIDKKNLEEKIVLISVENERIQQVAQDLRGEVEEWKRRYHELDRERGGNLREIEELRIQFENLKQMNIQVKELQQKFSAERIAYETQILQLNQVVTEIEHRNKYLTAENERLNGVSVQRMTIIEELRCQIDDESHKLEVYELKNNLEVLKSNTYDVKQLSAQYSAERAADQAKIAELSGLVNTYKNEIQKLSEIIEMRKRDCETLSRQNEELRGMCNKLNQSRNSFSPERSQNMEMLHFKIQELEAQRDEYQRIADKNAIDLTRKNRELVDKIQELDVLKLKYEEAYANYHALNNQLFNRYSQH